MPAELQHVVLTNVSAPLRAGDAPLPDERVWYLLGFFLDACLPSVAAQTADHLWLVWFDDRCDPGIVAEVERLAEGTFTPVWGGVFDAASVAAVVGGYVSAPWVATTVVSCDDALARDALARAAAEHDGSATTLVRFPEGLTIDRTGGVFAARDEAAPVRTLIEPGGSDVVLATVLGAEALDARVRSVGGPMWIDVDHEPLDSDPARGRRVDPGVVAERFDIDLAYDRDVSAGDLRAARRRDLRRAGRQLLRDPRLGPQLGRMLRGVRSVGWSGRSVLNVAADAVARRGASSAGLRPVAGEPDAVVAGERVAVLAEFDRTPQVRPWALRMAGALAEAGYPCLVVCARERGQRVDPPADLPPGVAVVARANARYDFGSWAAALEAWPGLAEAHVLLTNDSIIGPLTGGSAELAALLERGEADPAQVFAATRGRTGADHLQSYFLLFEPGVLAHPAVRRFFADLPLTRDRIDLVRRYEHGLTALLREEGVTYAAAWEPASFGYSADVNPSLCWRELFDAGFPFLKRRLLTHPRFEAARPEIRAHVRQRYGVDL